MKRQCSLLLLAAVVGLAAPCGRLFADAKPTDAKPAAVQVTVDVSEAPDLKEWGDKAKALVEKWQPIIAGLLKSDGFTPPSEVKIVFKKDMKGVAYTSGNVITIAAKWVQRHPDDFGMVAHELTHVVQSYRGAPRDAGWVVEGMADYVRFFKYEPDADLGPVNTGNAGYRDGYRTAAKFLFWIEKTHDKDIIAQLNQALRDSEYKESLFKKATGKALDDLWDEFVDSEKK